MTNVTNTPVLVSEVFPEKPFFSIVIPTYQRAHTISRAIFSVLSQTYNNFEVIIVDDKKSKDHIETKIISLNDPRIRLEKHFSGNAAAARNRGVRLARGKYIAFLDADDEFLPNKLKIYHERLLKSPKALLFSQNFVDRGVGRYWVKPVRGPLPDEDIFDYLFIAKGWIHPSTIVIKTELALEHPFQESLCFGDDTQFVADLWRVGVNFEMIELPLSIYEDLFDPIRLSQIPVFNIKNDPANIGFLYWVESQRSIMSESAYLAYRAQFLSRFLARTTPWQAFQDILLAWKSGAISFKAMNRQLVQTFFPRLYRGISDVIARILGQPLNIELK